VGRRAKNCAVDELIKEWGKVRRKLIGVDDPEKSKEFIGALRCTLAQRRDLHAGSRSNKIDQHWPEVYEGDAQLVNQAFHRMRPALKVVMELHYCAHASVQRKADFLALSYDTYLREVNDVRAFVEGFLASREAAA
jgi:hypothetical protein